jgi:hypothetical protein
MKIRFISTIKINPGDNFIKFGIENLIKEINPNIVSDTLNKHKPYLNLDKFNNDSELKTNWRISKYYFKFVNFMTHSFKKENLLYIHCGMPFFYNFNGFIFKITTFNSLWYKVFYTKKFMKSDNRLLLLSIGTTVYSENEYSKILKNKNYMQKVKEIGYKSDLIVTRDVKTKEIFNTANIESTYLPCSSLFTFSNKEINFDDKKYVLINVMENGSNGYKNIPKNEKWDSKILNLINEINKDHEIKFVSHSKSDYQFSKKIFPEYENFYFEDWKQYLKIYKMAYAGIFNRIHAAMINTSALNPTICINVDSRIEMLSRLSIPTFNSDEFQVTDLMSQFNSSIENISDFRRDIEKLKTFEKNNYLSKLKNVI